MHLLTSLLLLPTLILASLNGPCSIDGTPGVCITTTSCSSADGSFRSGFCPNDPDNVRCCIKPECGSGGKCQPESTCSGTTRTGLCPGPADFKCCEPSSGGGGGGGGSAGDHSLSSNGVDFIAGFEGFRADFYDDGTGVTTIGYGHACQTAGECSDIDAPITEAEGKALLSSDANSFEDCVNEDVTVAINQNQFDALVSFAFNLGCGNLANIADTLNDNDFSGATDQMLQYTHAGGEELPGLVRRRREEAKDEAEP
ncbi:MAG: hypothetical protein Q9222_003313 [Ikaeria aurantiellina]